MKFEGLEEDVDIKNVKLKNQEILQVGFDICLISLSFGYNVHSLVFYCLVSTPSDFLKFVSFVLFVKENMNLITFVFNILLVATENRKKRYLLTLYIKHRKLSVYLTVHCQGPPKPWVKQEVFIFIEAFYLYLASFIFEGGSNTKKF